VAPFLHNVPEFKSQGNALAILKKKYFFIIRFLHGHKEINKNNLKRISQFSPV
jgi:hypothetical protein